MLNPLNALPVQYDVVAHLETMFGHALKAVQTKSDKLHTEATGHELKGVRRISTADSKTASESDRMIPLADADHDKDF